MNASPVLGFDSLPGFLEALEARALHHEVCPLLADEVLYLRPEVVPQLLHRSRALPAVPPLSLALPPPRDLAVTFHIRTELIEGPSSRH